MVREIFGNELPPTEVSKDSDIFHNQLTNEDFVFDNGKWNLLPQQLEPENPTIPEPKVADAGKVLTVNSAGKYELKTPETGTQLPIPTYREDAKVLGVYQSEYAFIGNSFTVHVTASSDYGGYKVLDKTFHEILTAVQNDSWPVLRSEGEDRYYNAGTITQCGKETNASGYYYVVVDDYVEYWTQDESMGDLVESDYFN